MGRAGTVYTRFKADLSQYVEHRPGILHRIIIPSFGEIGLSTLRLVRPWTEWIAGWGYDINGPEPDLRAEAVLPRVRNMIGDPDVDIEIEDVSAWQINQAWATHYSVGRVFCGGDAVHRHPPSSGLGSNTSIQDAFNLAWKITYVLKGWAEPELLETYSDERAPIGEQVVARANQSRADYALLNEVLGATSVEANRNNLSLLRDTGPDGKAARAALVTAVERKNYEFNAQGIELNQRYASTAVVPDPEIGEEVWPRDRSLYLQATTRPGAKIPHVWLVNETGHKISTLDVTGHGMFSLVTGLSGGAWAKAAEQLDLPFLQTVVIGRSNARDSYHDWHRMREIDEAGALLVRPDGFVAWRHGAAVVDEAVAYRSLQEAFALILSRPVVR
jgi:2,4-dichlorophenol 6-monooxygenase